MLQSASANTTVSISSTPFEQLPENVQDVVLHGSGREKITFLYVGERGNKHVREHAFEGVIPNLERRYQETDSVVVREELAKYPQHPALPRVRRHAAAARSAPRHRGRQGDLRGERAAAGRALQFFEELASTGTKQAIAEKIVREIVNRLHFLNNVGLDYLSLDRSADTLSGGEAQRIRLASQIGSGLTGVMYVLDEPSIGLHQRDNERLLAR